MEKVILVNGLEFDLIPNGIEEFDNSIVFSILPGESSVEDLFEYFADNDTITVHNESISIRSFSNYTICDQVAAIHDYIYDIKYKCPECEAEVSPRATTCHACNSTFEHPNEVILSGTVCKVMVKRPDINNRMTDAEGAIEDIINTILGI